MLNIAKFDIRVPPDSIIFLLGASIKNILHKHNTILSVAVLDQFHGGGRNIFHIKYNKYSKIEVINKFISCNNFIFTK